jgi:nanoRNase/pAp phosphatase (c-di-AMP/oligoRNAs hydrolase)
VSPPSTSGLSRAHDLDDRLGAAEELTIVCHNNPDPDCLGSAFALGWIATAAGIDERCILYSGEISHQQNRGFVNLLGIELTPFEAEAVQDRPEGSLLAFVDDGIQISARSTDSRVHIGQVLDAAFEDVGSAGGHREMAGGEVPLGVFADYTTDDAQLCSIVEQVITSRLVAELNLAEGGGS